MLFSLPQITHCGPHHRFQWKPLPQSIMNSPTLCQLYVDAALNLVRHFWPRLYISHYMDDILFAGPDIEELESLLKVLPTYFEPFGLVIAPEKIQRDLVVNYLGYVVSRTTVRPQKVSLRRDSLQTLNDFQKLLGDINWPCPTLGIPTYQLHNLFSLLLNLSLTKALIIEMHKVYSLIQQSKIKICALYAMVLLFS